MSWLPFIFIHPWILASFLALPLAFFVLRIFPPTPRKIYFPALHFLYGLKPDHNSAERASWWIVVLRLSILACLILGLAEPVKKPIPEPSSSLPLRIVLDNNWASAQSWSAQLSKVEEYLTAAKNQNRDIVVLPTISEDIQKDEIKNRASLRKLSPHPLPNDLNKFCRNIKGEAETVWISSGVQEDNLQDCLQQLSKLGPTSILVPPTVPRLATSETDAKGIKGAGGVYLSNSKSASSDIGILIQNKEDSFDHPFSAAFYLAKAADGIAKVTQGSIDELIERSVGTIIFTDSVSLSSESENKLRPWVERGGILLQFAGPMMADEEKHVLLPVELLSGDRNLQGPITGGRNLKLQSFGVHSPFSGMPVPDIHVQRQIVADPATLNPENIWATLSDQTPLITAKNLNKGLLILVHTSATPEWSDFILSGFVIEFLKKISDLSKIDDKTLIPTSKILRPYQILDGWGELQKPDIAVKSIKKDDFKNIDISAEYPPGLYGTAKNFFALNLGDKIPAPAPIIDTPENVKINALEIIPQDQNYKAKFIFLSLALFLIDWLIYLFIIRPFQLFKFLFPIFIIWASSAMAVETDIENAAHLHLACVKSADTNLNTSCLKALENLALAIKARTATDISGATLVDPEDENLSLYPLLYWPIGEGSKNLTITGIENIKKYLSNGGMIYLDTRDGSVKSQSMLASPNLDLARRILSQLDIQKLSPAPNDFVLFKSFYLLSLGSEQGTWCDPETFSTEKTASILIGGQDLISGLTVNGDNEIALRFGVNLVMYSLTGNYKSDQIHMKTILRRITP